MLSVSVTAVKHVKHIIIYNLAISERAVTLYIPRKTEKY